MLEVAFSKYRHQTAWCCFFSQQEQQTCVQISGLDSVFPSAHQNKITLLLIVSLMLPAQTTPPDY